MGGMATVFSVMVALAMPVAALAQSALGQPVTVPPPRPAATPPATAAAPATSSGQAQATPPRSATAETRPRAAATTTRPPNTQAKPNTAQRPPAPRRATPTPVVAPAAPAAAAPAPTPEPPAPEPTQGSATGLPLPRFVPLRSDRVNLRVGPDTRFPIEWRYERRDLPVQIIREHEQWRRIRDIDGTEGWVHQSNLTPNRRTFLVRSNPAGEVVMRRRPEAEAQPVARLRAGVIGRLRACEQNSAWCEVQAQDSRGFVMRSDIFGVMPTEKVE
jgi:SH3-like domain-containing protein